MRSISLRIFSEGDCSPVSMWLEILAVFYSCATRVQNHICTKGSYLGITLHSFCAGQKYNVMCQAKELGMNFFSNPLFSERVSEV